MAAKEIWYSWDGNTERDMSFRKYVAAIMYGEGVICEREDLDMVIKGERFFWEIGINKRTTIVAYTLGETRERDWCKTCDGYGFVQKRLSALGFLYEHKKCSNCQGRGYIWKKGEKK